MKKILCIVAVTAMAFAVQAEEATKDDGVGSIGVGYQGLFLGNLLNGVAVRGTPAPIGWQVEFTQGMLDVDGSSEVELLVLKGKVYYALVERENSKLYTGASVGYWMAEFSGADIDGFSIAPLIGAEWNFTELQELGFNFEVSYEFNELEADGGGDLGIYGINVSTGIVYYF